MTRDDAQKRYDALDAKLGEDAGATKERAKLRKLGARTRTEQMTSFVRGHCKFSVSPVRRVIRKPASI